MRRICPACDEGRHRRCPDVTQPTGTMMCECPHTDHPNHYSSDGDDAQLLYIGQPLRQIESGFKIIKIQGEEYEEAPWTQSRVYSDFGRSYKYLTCGFCGDTVKAFLWSLSGGGKKCTCGAKHNAYGTSTRKKAS